MKTSKITISFSIILFLCSLIVEPVWAQVKPAPTGAKINILSCPDITGRARDMVYPIHWGVQVWFDYLNEEKGGIDGVPINVIVADGKYDVTVIRSIYKRYVDQVHTMTFVGQSVAYDALLNDFKKDKMWRA
jgi:ABC-type branched-subunit amino acid transport system substrate-binding protein